MAATVEVLDMFAGYGGTTEGFKAAGLSVIYAANHAENAVRVHEANNPDCEHFLADLVNETEKSYIHPADLPAALWFHASPSCTHHSSANATKAISAGLTLFDIHDEEYEDRVTESERSRATAYCMLDYARKHRPKIVTMENVCEFQAWGKLLPGSKSIGDGSDYRWWMAEWALLGYEHKILFLNSQFFGVPQSRDRMYIVFWQEGMREPDLEHRPEAWCGRCDCTVEAMWSWRTGIPKSGRVRYGEQYDYRCPSCRAQVVPPTTPAYLAIDWSDLGTRVGDREKPLVPATMARIERAIAKFPDFPAILIPASGTDATRSARPVEWPMGTQTGRHETALLHGAQIVGAGNTFQREGSDCRVRGFDEPMWTQPATNTLGIVHGGLVPYRAGNVPTSLAEPMATQATHDAFGLVHGGVVPMRANTIPTNVCEPAPTQTAGQLPMLLSASVIKVNGSEAEAAYRSHPVTIPFGALTAVGAKPHLLTAAWSKINGGPADTAWHPMTDAFGTMTTHEGAGTGICLADYMEALRGLTPEDCFYRMAKEIEVQRGMGFPSDFITFGTKREIVRGLGNAVTPPVPRWIAQRVVVIL